MHYLSTLLRFLWNNKINALCEDVYLLISIDILYFGLSFRLKNWQDSHLGYISTSYETLNNRWISCQTSFLVGETERQGNSFFRKTTCFKFFELFIRNGSSMYFICLLFWIFFLLLSKNAQFVIIDYYTKMKYFIKYLDQIPGDFFVLWTTQ